jgi:hypothetical protein
MGDLTNVSTISHVIQLAVAPVFLLSGIGAMLAVMTNRLSRIIDRARVLESRLEHATPEESGRLQEDLVTLRQRARLIGPAITLCTGTALLICMVIAVLFLSAFFNFDAGVIVAILFILSMLAFFLGLLWFLREIFVATRNLRIGSRHVHPRSLMMVLVAATLPGQPPALPAGVVRVSFGIAERTKNAAGTETCRIRSPFGAPATFEHGTTELTYAVELEPRAVKSAQARVIVPAEQPLRALPCNVFTLVRGGFSQTQIGNTLSRTDGKPLTPGAYRLHITVDGQTADVPFTIK